MACPWGCSIFTWKGPRHLRTAGYTERTLRKKRPILAAFARWSRREQIALDRLGDADIAEFVERSSVAGAGAARVRFERAVLRLLLQYLRAQTWAPSPVPVDASCDDVLAKRYADYLRQDRGLAENSVRVYLPLIRGFLTGRLPPAAVCLPTHSTRRRSEAISWPIASIGRLNMFGSWPQHCDRSSTSSSFAEIHRVTSALQFPQCARGVNLQCRPSSRPKKRSVFSRLRIGRHLAVAVTTRSSSCWLGSVCVRGRSSRSNSVTFVGVQGRSSSTAKADRWNTFRCYPTLARRWLSIFTRTAAPAYRDESSCGCWHHALAWRVQPRLAISCAWPSLAPGCARRVAVLRICSVTAWRPP